MRFVDTNILLYSVSVDARDAAKREIAVLLLESPDLALSIQVLQEFYAQATRPARPGRLTDDQAARFVAAMKRFPIQPQTIEVLERAIAIRARTKLSYWDSAIIAAAAIMGCGVVLSEDMQHGQIVDGIRIVDPFQ